MTGAVIAASWLLAAAAPAVAETPGPAALEVRAATFNIRYGTAEDGPNHWSERRHPALSTLRDLDADFLGLQEALPFQIDEIAAALPAHDALWRTREVDPATGEACPIFYRSDRWELDARRHGTFWLSESPEQPGSTGWDAALPRIVTWGRFVHRATGAPVLVFNAHFDHVGETAREKSAELLRERVATESGGDPVLVLGDFNAGESSDAMAALRRPLDSGVELVDSFRRLHPDARDVFTANGWGEATDGEKIDAILVPRDSEVLDAAILRPRFEGRAPSDHDPVTATVRLPIEWIEIEIGDLGECRSCGGAIVRAVERVPGVWRAVLHPTEPVVVVSASPRVTVEHERLRAAVRDAGYTPAQIRPAQIRPAQTRPVEARPIEIRPPGASDPGR